MWRMKAELARTLPDAVRRKRFFAPLLVFIFGIFIPFRRDAVNVRDGWACLWAAPSGSEVRFIAGGNGLFKARAATAPSCSGLADDNPTDRPCRPGPDLPRRSRPDPTPAPSADRGCRSDCRPPAGRYSAPPDRRLSGRRRAGAAEWKTHR